MSDLRKRLLRRGLLVVAVLGTMGYIFGKTFLMFASQYSASSTDPANQRVLWQTPLVMAGFGLILTAILEALSFAFRRRMKPAPVAAVRQPTAEELVLRILAEQEKKS